MVSLKYVTVRRALADDAGAIAAVHVESSRAAYKGILSDSRFDKFTIETRNALWAEALMNPTPESITLVGVDAHLGVIGFASGGRERTGELECDGELYVIYLLPTAQRQGLGTLLTRRFAEELRVRHLQSMAVWVLAASPFRSFYEKLGGRIIAERTTERDAQMFTEIAYGWKNLNDLSP